MHKSKNIRKERQKKAEKLTHKLVKEIDENPYELSNYYELGTILTEMQSFPQAEELFKKALTIFHEKDQQSKINYGLGNVYYCAGLYPEAIDAFQKVTDKELSGNAYLMIGQAFYAQNQYQQAMAFALTASEQLKNDIEPVKLLGDCFFALGDLNQAKEYYLKALSMNENDVHTNFQLGIIGFVKESQEVGNLYFKKVKQLDPNYYKKMYSRLNDIEKAIESKDINSKNE
ncbi:tetratricopeptide repeat protein [Ligilactobacillus cholophilus]|uniref:tetratricopeptide repeat protein n=1 Tax=Ligilactobacillus cholophilus TaxID=3050131 RepID=UPI0025B1E39B|nr:tetratricopeptide repeat protein [Ligilactobacillus cholophilus]